MSGLTTKFFKVLILLTTLLFVGCSHYKKPELSRYASKKLTNFASEKEFNNYLKYAHKLNQYRNKRYEEAYKNEDNQKVVITGSRISNTPASITNNQVAGVDEGDIIKLAGDYLIVLRRGKLFSILLKNGNHNTIKPTDKIAVTPPGWNYDSWYDEMLVLDNIIIVLGYSYDLGASELLRYEINDRGKLTYKDGFLISSGDYFSLDNYASRLYKGKYITYIPNTLYDEDTYYLTKRKPSFPRIAKITSSNKESLRWRELIDHQDIRKPLQNVVSPTLHTLLTCDPLSNNFSCNAKGIISSANSYYYVSKDNFYLWTQAFSKELLYNHNFDDELDFSFQLEDNKNISKHLDAIVFKFSLENDDISAARVSGQPIDQFSFHERNDNLHMMLIDGRSASGKESASLYTIPIEYFDSRASYLAQSIELGLVNDEVNNRFTDNHLIIGTGSTFKYSKNKSYELKPTFDVSIYDLDNQSYLKLNTSHSADRLEPVGKDVFISGLTQNGNLAVTIVDPINMTKLASKEFPTILEQETRSHAFNSYVTEDETIVMGLTTVNKIDANKNYGPFRYYWDDNQSSDIFYIGMDSNNSLYEAGKLVSRFKFTGNEDNCIVSCYDWYGNTRPFFIENRIFGLSGDELIEAKYSNGNIESLQQVNITSSILP